MTIKVTQFMTRSVVTVSMEAPVIEAVRLLRKHKVKGIPVVDDAGRVAGMFTLKNLLYIVEEHANLDIPVKEVMQHDILTISDETPFDEICFYPTKRLPVLSTDGKLVGILTKTDILRAFKTRSTRTLQQLEAVLEATPARIIVVNEAGLITFANGAVDHILKSEGGTVVGQLFDDVFPELSAICKVVLVDNETVRDIKKCINGYSYILHAAPLVDSGDMLGAVICLQPLSEIERLAEELNVVKQLYKELDAVIEYSYDGIFVTDSSGRILKMNAATGKLLGFDPVSSINVKVEELAKYHRLRGCVTAKVLKERKNQSVSYKINGKSIVLTGNPVLDESGNIIRVVTNVRDLTELSTLKQELEEVSRLKELYYSELSRLKVQVASNTEVFRSEQMQRIYDLTLRVAIVDTPILIQGESGVGKEVVADYIHYNSMRRDKPFIKVNCAAIPEPLLESELFGYMDGAFTGAKKGGKPGVFEVANGGTLFLDEIGEMPCSIQAKLLRALQDQEILKIGASSPVKFNVRLLFATNRNLEEAVKCGRFREDLFYRINVVPITIPPLRERPADIVVLVATYLDKFNEKYCVDKKLSSEVLECFTAYNWPGNVRELINLLERLVITCQQEIITFEDLPRNISQRVLQKLSLRKGPLLPLKTALGTVERDLIERALRECPSLRQAARTLGIDPSTLLRKAERYKVRSPVGAVQQALPLSNEEN